MGRPQLPRDQQILHLRQWRQDVREHVALRAGFRCQCCHAFTGMDGEGDHIVSRRDLARVGGNPWDTLNLQWLCASCHSRKTNAERWQGYERKPRPAFRRAKLPGRARFLQAAGIPDNQPATP